MTTESSKEYQQALDLADAGQFQEAYDLIQNYLHENPNDAEALNDTGVLLHCMHRSDESIGFFTRAREIDGDTAEIVWNLAEAYLAEGRAEEARPLLQVMADNGTLSADILNRTAKIFVDTDQLQAATDLLNWSLDLCSEQEILRPMIEVIESYKQKTDSVSSIESV